MLYLYAVFLLIGTGCFVNGTLYAHLYFMPVNESSFNTGNTRVESETHTEGGWR